MVELKNIAIIDGSYMLHRVMKQPALFNLRNKKLERTGGIFGFFQTLQKEIKLTTYYPIVCWDEGQSNRRLKIYPNYKKHEDKKNDTTIKSFSEMTEDELDEDYAYNYKLQRSKIIMILDALGIPSLLFPHVEGDDLMYWLSKHCNKSKVITDDKDLLQLLSDNCVVRRPMHNTTIKLNDFLQENNFNSINDFVKQKALCGDSSDNIPGACYRVGEKTSNDFFKVYESLNQNENIDIINDETQLKNYCKSNNLPYKKAFINFNLQQYLDNLNLVDLIMKYIKQLKKHIKILS